MSELKATSATPTAQGSAFPANWGGKTIVVLILFMLSGASGLIYEVVWARMLTYIFGATIYAVATVLAAFMGGLALGSWLMGRWADRLRNPLRFYAWLELIVAASVALLPLALKLCDPIYRLMYLQLPQSFGVFTFLRFLLTFAILLVPTTCMGATLPVLSRWSARSQAVIGLSLGRLYAANTCGAVAGCFFAGFIGLGNLGVTGTLYLAVGINVLVFLVAWAMSLKDRPPLLEQESALKQTSAVETAPSLVVENITPQLQKLVFWIYGGSGLVALALQVVWFRTLIFSFQELKNTTYTFSAMLTVFLIGLATGSGIGSRIVDTLTHPVRCFALVQAGIGISAMFSFFVIYGFAGDFAPFLSLEPDGTFYFYRAVGNLFTKTLAAIFFPTFLMGLTYPVAVKILVSVRGAGMAVGRLYAVNTLGAILGAILGGFFLIPLFGLAYTLFFLALLSLAFALTIVFKHEDYSPELRRVIAGAVAVAVVIVWWRMKPDQAIIQDAYLNTNIERTVRSATGYEPDAYREGPLATVAVVQNSQGDRTLYIDGVPVAGTGRILLTDQKSLAHIPMLFRDDPKTALTVGFGSGGASWSFLQYASLERVDCLEICRTVLEMAPYLKASNHGVLDEETRDPRLNIIIDDARSYLRFTDQQYDIIATDCTDLRYKTNANLYDLEYFEICKKRLTEQGLVVVWMPLAGLTDEAFRVALRTFTHVFPEMTIWYMNNEPTHYILLLGTHENQPLKINVKLMEEKLNTQLPVKTDLAELYLDSAEKLLSCYVTDAEELQAELAGDLVNTENNPYLEFQSPLFGYDEQPLFDNLDLLFSHRGDVRKHLDPQTMPPDFSARLEPYEAIVTELLAGHKHYRRMEVAQSCEAYLRAQELNPADASVQQLLRFEVLEKNLAYNPNSEWDIVMQGEVFRLTGRFEEAISNYSQGWSIIQAKPPPDLEAAPENYLLWQRLQAQTLIGLGLCLVEGGYQEQLPELIENAKKLVERFPELSDMQQNLDKLIEQAKQLKERKKQEEAKKQEDKEDKKSLQG